MTVGNAGGADVVSFHEQQFDGHPSVLRQLGEAVLIDMPPE